MAEMRVMSVREERERIMADMMGSKRYDLEHISAVQDVLKVDTADHWGGRVKGRKMSYVVVG